MGPLTLTVLLAAAAAAAPGRSHVIRLAPEPLGAGQAVGPPLATLDTRARLDAELRAGPVVLAGRSWRFGLAADAEFKSFFLAVAGPQGTRLLPIEQPRRLLQEGQVFAFDDRSAFRVTVKPRWSDLLHGSEIRLRPLAGTPGPEARWQAGRLLDLLEKQASYFRKDGQDYFLVLVSDVDPELRKRAPTRSLVVFAQRRFRSRLWRLPAAELEPGRPARVRLGRRAFVLLLRPDGLLVVYAGA